MKHIIDIKTQERKENYEFFLGLQNPTVSIISEVGCSGAKTRAKVAGESLFLHYFCAVLHAISEIKEFRFRIDSKGQVVYLGIVDMLTSIKVADNGRSFTVRPPWRPDFKTFHTETKAIINKINPDRDPYEVEETGGNDLLDVMLLSVTPGLYLTSLTCTQEHRHGSNYPLMNMGKAVVGGGVSAMFIAMTIHHGFIDGYHLSLFYKKVEEFLK